MKHTKAPSMKKSAKPTKGFVAGPANQVKAISKGK